MIAMRKCEVFQFVYAPNPAAADSLTIGVGLFDIGGAGFAGVRFLKDWSRVQCLDPHKIDCGYKPDGTLRLFHAITLDTDATHSKALAFTYPSLSAGIQREHGAKAELTAVVQENFNPDDGGARFAFHLLRRSNILVATTADLPELAERARKELRV